MTISDPDTRQAQRDVRNRLEQRLLELRRSAIRPYAEAAIQGRWRAADVCSECGTSMTVAVETEAAAEYYRGRIHGLEEALEALAATQDGSPGHLGMAQAS